MSTPSDTCDLSNIVLCGRSRTTAGLAVCLAGSDTDVTVVTEHLTEDKRRINQHLSDVERYTGKSCSNNIFVNGEWPTEHTASMAIITGYSDTETIKSLIHKLEGYLSKELIIAVSTDHIPLNILQEDSNRPENIVVVNWAEPAHTTFFMEIVHNETTKPGIVTWLEKMGKEKWGKDPYTVHSELGVRGRLNTAMLREAMFLVEEGYANVEDIDRACRNDAGTYLPFVGHFQYMDLMGTYAYGVVMEKLNKELSNATDVPPFFEEVIKKDKAGMQNGGGFYDYSKEEEDEWEEKMREFSFEIKGLMESYLFGPSDERE